MEFSHATERALEGLTRRRLERDRRRAPATRDDIQSGVRAILEQMSIFAHDSAGERRFSLSRMVRGLAALRRRPIVAETAEVDAEYAKQLQTGTTPGSYLVPTITARTIVEQLGQYETFRAAGARVWPLAGIQKFVIPVGLSGPSFAWVAEGSRQSASDPNFGAINFDLKNLQSFELVPVQLFRTTRPEFDLLLEDIYALAIAEAADNAIHASSTLTGAPTALMSASVTFINAANNNANGGNLLYADLLAVVQRASDLKVRGPYCWVMNGRSWNRILSLQSTTSQPIVVPGAAAPPAVGTVLGFPAYLTESIGSTETVGSGSNQSHIIFTNPRAVHLGENAEITVSLSDEYAFEANQIAIRINRYADWDFQPAAAIIVLAGVN